MLVLTALLAYLNKKFIGLPPTNGAMATACLISLAVLYLDMLGFTTPRDTVEGMLKPFDFSDILMQGMLSVLLFAGALHIDLGELKAHRGRSRCSPYAARWRPWCWSAMG